MEINMDNISKTRKILSLILKITVFVSAAAGTFLSYYAGRNSFMGGKRVFMFFTIQSNIAIAIICAVGFFLMLKKAEIGRVWYTIKFVGTVSITLTGVVFAFVLAPTLKAGAWNIQNTLTHLVVPVAAVADFFVMSIVRIKKINALFVIIPPIIYAVYAGIGYVNNWQFIEGINYPYFFLNWGSKAGAFGFSDELPFMGCAWWILVLLVFLIAVGLLYLVIGDRIARRYSGNR